MEWETTASDQNMVKSSKCGWGLIYIHKVDKMPFSFSAEQKNFFPASSNNNTNKKTLSKPRTYLWTRLLPTAGAACKWEFISPPSTVRRKAEVKIANNHL